MIDFFKWWYTNEDGTEYMTLLGCSVNDLFIVVTTCILSAVVLYQYTIIGISAYAEARKHPNSVTKRYLIDKTNVFIICGICGYGYTILSAFINPYKLRILLLFILIVWTYRFIGSAKRTKVLRRILEAEQIVTKKLNDYTLIKSKFTSDDGDGLITFEELSTTQFNIWIDLGNGVKFMRIMHPTKPVYYITEMNPEESPNEIAEMGIQWHDCNEKCKVLKGHMIDAYDNARTYEVGETAAYNPLKKHKPLAKFKSIYEVEFYK